MAWRLQRHHLQRRAVRGAVVDVVARLGGVQAQLMFSTELSLWARLEHLELEDVQCALWEERSLVKTWAMRGTLHLLPAFELRLWQAMLSSWVALHQASHHLTEGQALRLRRFDLGCPWIPVNYNEPRRTRFRIRTPDSR